MLKATFIKTGSILLVLSVFFFASCKQPTDDPGSPTSEMVLTNIPVSLSTGENGTQSSPSYKVYVQLSSYMDDDKPNEAEGEFILTNTEAVDGKYSITVPLHKPNAPDQPWTGSGSYFLAFVIRPDDANTNSETDIDAWALQKTKFSAEKNSFIWGTNMINLENTNSAIYWPRFQAIYTKIVRKDIDGQ